MPEIELIGLVKRYGRITAVAGVDLHVSDGEYVGIIGPSGCGKSTLFRLIAGIERPDEGDVRFDGVSVLNVPMEERGVALVFQHIALFPHMSALGNAAYSPRVRGLSPPKAREIGLASLRAVGARSRPEASPSEMSMGEMQEVALARALASEAKVLLLDEPLSALDAKAALELRAKLRSIVKSRGLTALHVTHDQAEAMSVADRVAVMRAGGIVQVGTPQELYERPNSPFVMNFVGEANFLVGSIRAEEIGLHAGGTLERPDGFAEGELVVVGFRPEDVVLNEGQLEGRVKLRSYLGGMYRFEVLLTTGEIVKAVLPEDPGVHEGDMVRLDITKFRVFPYPEEGLARATAIE